MFERHHERGWRIGQHTQWYENGQKESEQYYKGGALNALVSKWNESGEKMTEERYTNGVQGGIFSYWLKKIKWKLQGRNKRHSKLNETRRKRA